MRVAGIDDAMVLPNLPGLKEAILWFEEPRTEAQIASLNRAIDAIAGRMAKSGADTDIEGFINLLKKSVEEERPGEPWTLRKAVVRAMYSTQYPEREKDPKTGQSKPEEPDVIAQMQNIGLAFCRAPHNRAVNLKDGQVGLIRRKARELGSGPGGMHPAVMALLEEALDFAEGGDAREKKRVSWEKDEEPLRLATMRPSGPGQMPVDLAAP
jgi:hypothetical protein